MKNADARQGLASGAAVVTVALTAAAFWLSYEHLHDVADANGLDGIRAWAWPGTVDLFIVAGELLILRAALRGGFDWFAYLLAGVGSLGSIALNVAGVGAGADRMEYIVAAVPPVAALLAFAAIMRQVHERLAGHSEPIKLDVIQHETAPEVTDLVDVIHEVPPAPEPAPVVIPTATALTAAPFLWESVSPEKTDQVTVAVPAETARQVVTESVTLTPSDLRRKARSLHREAVRSTRRPVTIKALQDELGLSRREATELRREVVEARS
ncbi:DUF2637 domain-containing protein [Streptomyces sp. ME02-8801-2C]|uniref:DUF2637 domain-containing protein n=1 Tax=Streptomyces sp. ME02-8801-2C TaxID=3028680 RepID=UPI0029B74676|nr:DUF2637 domain-containing protein [Streptomyces sp. ME02-8801-2C]MDX3458416.1 DUF2637 domain-containing protein [Streptomyces sp. ME02-8801-2C]